MHALSDPLIFLRAHILGDIGCHRHGKGSNRQEDETFRLGAGTDAGNGHGTETVDIGLNQDVGNIDDRALQSCRQAVICNLLQAFLVKSNMRDMQADRLRCF